MIDKESINSVTWREAEFIKNIIDCLEGSGDVGISTCLHKFKSAYNKDTDIIKFIPANVLFHCTAYVMIIRNSGVGIL